MTPQQFQSSSIAILRTSVGWQTKIAQKLDIATRTVQRWLVSGDIPEWVEKKFSEWTGLADQLPWPRDEWLIGDGPEINGNRREYIMHMQPPRFIARVVARRDDGLPEPTEEPADVISGTVYTSENYCLCEIVWIDQPRAGEIVQLMEAAADVIEG